MTLEDLTKQEAGIIISPDGGIIICNWNKCDDNCLPCLDPSGVSLMYSLEYHEADFESAEKEKIDDVYKYISKDYDDDEDIMSNLVFGNINDIFINSKNMPGTVYTLSDDTRIITPEDWD